MKNYNYGTRHIFSNSIDYDKSGFTRRSFFITRFYNREQGIYKKCSWSNDGYGLTSLTNRPFNPTNVLPSLINYGPETWESF